MKIHSSAMARLWQRNTMAHAMEIPCDAVTRATACATVRAMARGTRHGTSPGCPFMGGRGCTAAVALSSSIRIHCNDIHNHVKTAIRAPWGVMYDIYGSGSAMGPPMGRGHGKPCHFSWHNMAVGAMKPHGNAIAMNGHGAAMILP